MDRHYNTPVDRNYSPERSDATQDTTLTTYTHKCGHASDPVMPAMRDSTERYACKACNAAVREVRVVGDTYRNASKLRGLGLTWDAADKAWVGRCNPDNLPRGCRDAGASAGHGPCRHCGTYCYGDCQAN